MGSEASEFTETERKYEVDAGFVLPGLAGIPGVATVRPAGIHRLDAVYFDTTDLRLAGAKITLRRRSGGADAGWHLKLPVAADTRREVHEPLGAGGDGVPGRLAGLVSRWTGGRPLQPVARLETTRTLTHLSGPGGEMLAEIADDTVTGSRPAGAEPGAPAGWREVTSWREVEVELGSGPPGLLDAVEERLLAAGARRSAAASKLSRLLAAGGPAGNHP